VVVSAGQQEGQGQGRGGWSDGYSDSRGYSDSSADSLADRLVEKGLPLLRRQLAGAREVWACLGQWMTQQLVPSGQMKLCAEALVLHRPEPAEGL